MRLHGLGRFVAPYKLQILGAAIALLLAAATTLTFPYILKLLIDDAITPELKQSTGKLVDYFFYLMAVMVLLALFSAVRHYAVSWLGERITADIRKAVFSHVISQSPEFFETTKTGEVLSRLSSDTTLIQTVVGSSLSFGARNSVMAIATMVILFTTIPFLMLQIIAILAVIIIPIMFIGRLIRKIARSNQDKLAATSSVADEVISAIPVVQGYNAIKFETQRYAQAVTQAFDSALARLKIRSVMIVFVIISSSFALLWGVYQGTQEVIAGNISAGDLGQTVVYIAILGASLASLGEVYGDIMRAVGASERLIELLNSTNSIKEIKTPMQTIPKNSDICLEFCNVDFAYPSQLSKLALNNLTFQVKTGQSTAIVGTSGAGKSTIFSLIARFYDPTKGEIKLNGVNIENLSLDVLRENIGIVFQESTVFSGTVADNIRYGKQSATNTEIKQAAKLAFAEDFIDALPQGYNSFLGERGIRLSGGQKQRIAIARAILKNPALLLLDEATSSLDSQSEKYVQQALQQLMQSRTTIIIAHRLSTIQNAKQIIVLDNGSLIEQGNHSQLLQNKGIYAALAKLQFG